MPHFQMTKILPRDSREFDNPSCLLCLESNHLTYCTQLSHIKQSELIRVNHFCVADELNVVCKLCSADLTSYFAKMRDLSRLMVECLTEGLGLPRDTFTKLETSNAICNARVNHYPACPDPSKVFGIPGHKDPQMLSILYQDEVGGLQVVRNGKWIGIRPDDSTFVVNLGDTFEVLN